MQVSKHLHVETEHLSTNLVLTHFQNMQRKSASRCKVWQVALTCVVVINVFICCRRHENKQKKKRKTEARSEEQIQGVKGKLDKVG